MKSHNNPVQFKPPIKFIFTTSSIFALCIWISMTLMTTTKFVDVKSSIKSVSTPTKNVSTPTPTPTPTSVEHIVFGLGSGISVWHKRKDYVRLYWKPNKMRGCVFVGSLPKLKDNDTSIPPLCLSSNTSQFRYTWGPKGHLSANRMTRIIKDIVGMNYSNVRWYVFGDDDTIFFPENLVKVLSKYDHRLWYYIGARSESFLASQYFSFGMAFGGGGFAISSSLAKVLAKVIDSCLERYHYLYGSDARTYSCITELGAGLTHEPGFHQVDMLGDTFGLLATHPITPLLSLHHVNHTNPIFPKMTNMKALQHLFKAANVDSQRMLQQSVCYHKKLVWTVSVSWGYAIQLFPYNMPLPQVLKVPQTFKPWRNGNVMENAYNFDTRPIQRNPCDRPAIFYLDNISSHKNGTITSSYKKSFRNCHRDRPSLKTLEKIKVFSRKLDLNINQLKSPKRHCCDILPSNAKGVMQIGIRECGDEEMIKMKW
ncbi:hypothetical protein Lal_00034892 [Lupinus albus]|uniref:Uncharacterized protein n=1 Tax=Lupinus albus TaxID=3870 RepID=A0A6A4QT63_LUPAL|nr:hypothetical protein Lalb_Chr03g0026571 [Lupinus albus]KAF1897189.1 hypothetical protein Lal_00034892 [Lupinus albus]